MIYSTVDDTGQVMILQTWVSNPDMSLRLLMKLNDLLLNKDWTYYSILSATLYMSFKECM